jgi:hypothetical protein
MASVPPRAQTGKPTVFVPHRDDLDDVRASFEDDEKHPEARVTVSPEELRRWAETGEWPESSG